MLTRSYELSAESIVAHEKFFREHWCDLRNLAGKVQELPPSPIEGSGWASSIARAGSIG
jgi:hypothetical protein